MVWAVPGGGGGGKKLKNLILNGGMGIVTQKFLNYIRMSSGQKEVWISTAWIGVFWERGMLYSFLKTFDTIEGSMYLNIFITIPSFWYI